MLCRTRINYILTRRVILPFNDTIWEMTPDWDHLDHDNAHPGNGNLVAVDPPVQARLPECRLMCSSSECLVVSALLHMVQVYGRSPVCIRVWTCRECFWVKPFPHSLHLKGRSPGIRAPENWSKQESAHLSVSSQIKDNKGMTLNRHISKRPMNRRHSISNKILQAGIDKSEARSEEC